MEKAAAGCGKGECCVSEGSGDRRETRAGRTLLVVLVIGGHDACFFYGLNESTQGDDCQEMQRDSSMSTSTLELVVDRGGETVMTGGGTRLAHGSK